jgi:hypothetical protein
MKIIKCCVCKIDKLSNNYSVWHGRVNKTCNECRKYHNDRYTFNKDGYKDFRKNYYLLNKAKHRQRTFKNHILRKYGLSVEKYNEILSRQKNKCRICDRDFNSLKAWNRPCVDHCHKTGQVRGILCKKCNLTLSYIEDFNLWEKAQSYLQFNDVEDKELLR